MKGKEERSSAGRGKRKATYGLKGGGLAENPSRKAIFQMAPFPPP